MTCGNNKARHASLRFHQSSHVISRVRVIRHVAVQSFLGRLALTRVFPEFDRYANNVSKSHLVGCTAA